MREIREGLDTVDRRVASALVYVALALTVIEYHFLPQVVEARLSGAHWGPISLAAGASWAWMTSLLYLLPTLWFLARRRPLDSIGYRIKGLGRHLWFYAVLFLIMAPFVWLASRRPDFAQTYPFVFAARTNWTDFWLWEASYLFQFFALEAFFRGYLLFTLERRFGWNAIFVMAVPYVMIHYHKPFPEALGALVAGIVLGALALRLRSFYGGFFLHAAVALTMDYLGARGSGLS